ncbi:BnaA04g21300D [Brassica napus]|uniref:BnaA04g21300D protein n=1 Tax=Brassica napus TaxID=3708 RepID=A0A078G0D9_BRANA|nr:BnaA04g21300D [Brassica napus]
MTLRHSQKQMHISLLTIHQIRSQESTH